MPQPLPHNDRPAASPEETTPRPPLEGNTGLKVVKTELKKILGELKSRPNSSAKLATAILSLSRAENMVFTAEDTLDPSQAVEELLNARALVHKVAKGSDQVLGKAVSVITDDVDKRLGEVIGSLVPPLARSR